MTRLTYTHDEIEGPFEVSPDGTVKFEEKDGIDYAAVTVQLPGGERVPFLFKVKQLVASGKPESFGGEFLVPSYRGSSFLDPKGRGGSTGYDNAVASPAGGRGDEEELKKENIKDPSSSKGKITSSVTQCKPETGELIGVFESTSSPRILIWGRKRGRMLRSKVFGMVSSSRRKDDVEFILSRF